MVGFCPEDDADENTARIIINTAKIPMISAMVIFPKTGCPPFLPACPPFMPSVSGLSSSLANKIPDYSSEFHE
jgi:hypothetical protein